MKRTIYCSIGKKIEKETSASGRVFRPRSFLSSNNPPPIILRASSLIKTSLASNFRSGILGLDSIVYKVIKAIRTRESSLLMTNYYYKLGCTRYSIAQKTKSIRCKHFITLYAPILETYPTYSKEGLEFHKRLSNKKLRQSRDKT